MFETSEQFSIDPDYTGLPDPEHFDTVMDGVLDSVSGNEGLSYAQHYLFSCLQSSGGISSRTGTEGFFSSIGSGLKAAWDYIVKMFKSVWNFFFGSGEDSDKKKQESASAEVEKTTELFAACSAKPKDPAITAKLMKGLKGKAKAVVNDPKSSSSDKKEAGEVVEKLDKWAEEQDWQPELHKVAEQVMRFSKADKSALKAAIEKFAEHLVKLFPAMQAGDTPVSKSNKAMELQQKMMEEIRPANVHLNETVKKIKAGVNSLFDAKDLQVVLKDCIAAKGNVSAIIARHKNEVQQVMTQLNQEVTKPNVEDTRILHDDLEGCKALIGLINRTAKLSDLVYTSAKGISKANARLIAA